MAATNVIYSFWWGELCDIFIVGFSCSRSIMAPTDLVGCQQEAAKPITDPSAAPEVRKSAQNTLYTCLDYGLRLLHPFMPFVTEELWQRLPRRPNDTTPSIMLASFPEAVRVHSDFGCGSNETLKG
jgi:valyl-tRNA synthetase